MHTQTFPSPTARPRSFLRPASPSPSLYRAPELPLFLARTHLALIDLPLHGAIARGERPMTFPSPSSLSPCSRFRKWRPESPSGEAPTGSHGGRCRESDVRALCQSMSFSLSLLSPARQPRPAAPLPTGGAHPPAPPAAADMATVLQRASLISRLRASKAPGHGRPPQIRGDGGGAVRIWGGDAEPPRC